jgi:hypothetical protein
MEVVGSDADAEASKRDRRALRRRSNSAFRDGTRIPRPRKVSAETSRATRSWLVSATACGGPASKSLRTPRSTYLREPPRCSPVPSAAAWSPKCAVRLLRSPTHPASSSSTKAASRSVRPRRRSRSGTTAEAGLRSPAIHAIASATRTAIAAVGAAPALPSSTVKKPAGTWLVLHGGLVGTAGSGRVAVFIQRAHPTLVAPLLLKAYGLTPREQEVAQLVLRGATAIQAAQRFAILPPPSTIT